MGNNFPGYDARCLSSHWHALFAISLWPQSKLFPGLVADVLGLGSLGFPEQFP